jgi:hypothetical protein
MSTVATYYAYPQVLDFGSITLGNNLTLPVRIQYNLAPAQSVGSVLSSQVSISNEVFAIDDQGSNAEEVVKLSTDNANFYNRINVSSFPATEPPNTITLYVNVSPDASKISASGDFIVYLTSVQVPSFQVPIHFRIVNGFYVSTSDVRQSMGEFGKQKVNIFAFHDLFTDSSFPLWTNITGSWSQSVNGNRRGTTTATAHAISETAFQDFGDYNVSSWVTLNQPGAAGLIFAYTDSTDFYRATINTSSGRALIESVIGGVTTVMATTSVGVLTSSPYSLRVEKHPTSADFFVAEQKVLSAVGLILSGPSGLTVTSAGNNPTADFQEYHVSEDAYQFDDASINTTILEEQEFIEQRIGRVYSAQTVTELHDWDDRQPVRMPFIPARTFNMVPTGTQMAGSGQDQRTFYVYESALYLRQRPVLGVVALEEDTGADGSTPSWTLRTQGRSGDFVVYPELGKIVFLNNLPNNGHQNLRVIYNVGSAKVPAFIKGYLKEKVALRMLENLGTTADGIKEMVAKKEERLKQYEEFIPQKTIIYAVGSKQPLR